MLTVEEFINITLLEREIVPLRDCYEPPNQALCDRYVPHSSPTSYLTGYDEKILKIQEINRNASDSPTHRSLRSLRSKLRGMRRISHFVTGISEITNWVKVAAKLQGIRPNL